MTETIILKNPYINGFTDASDPEALAYLERFKKVKTALMAGKTNPRHLTLNDGEKWIANVAPIIYSDISIIPIKLIPDFENTRSGEDT